MFLIVFLQINLTLGLAVLQVKKYSVLTLWLSVAHFVKAIPAGISMAKYTTHSHRVGIYTRLMSVGPLQSSIIYAEIMTV